MTKEQKRELADVDRLLIEAAAGIETLSPEDQQLVIDLLRAKVREAVRVNAESREVQS